VYETEEDLLRLQELIERSHAGAGEHLRAIFDDERRIPAAELPALLRGVQVLALATVTARGEPRVAPVDGLFFRGRWHFGSSERSARFRHIRGRAVEIDPRGPGEEAFRAYLNETYPGWDDADWAAGAPYARIEPSAMFTFRAER
jgi:hypothetical protein